MSEKKVRWGVISTANIGTKKVIPAMQRGQFSTVAGIASRNIEGAQKAAALLAIPKAYGSYEELLADPEIDAIYNPLPNHLHVEWSLKALEAGKHVLCEKPLGLDAVDAQKLADAALEYPELKVMEAFMYRHHPQWKAAQQIVSSGGIGEVRAIQSFFSYFNDDAGNIRNMAEIGGGGLMDIGCYSISLSRFLFGSMPRHVVGMVDIDPEFGCDRMFSGMMDFGGRTASFTCSTQLSPYQRVNVLGTTGRVEILIPFNAPPHVPCEIIHENEGVISNMKFPPCDQYTAQGDLMSRAILDDVAVPTPLTDAVLNMKVLDALKESAEKGEWVDIKS